ncbi:zinc finger protein [Cucumis melo var. makuwa]|uniref:Zinc finger protein n=1 Tax=Cucumis melo var. makuwa TaxID=1194695 RepID=A0A5A7TQB3_CUCMM|nr:zinc finger protein [Cucumis melo var. makuwa]
MAAGKQNLAEEDGGDPLKNRFGAPNLKAGGDSTEDKCPSLHQKFDKHPMEAPSLAAMNTEEHSEISKSPQIPIHSAKRLAFSPLSSPTFSVAAVSPGTSPSESKSNAEGTNMNSQHAHLRPDVEMSPIIPCEVSRVVASQSPRISRSSSLTKLKLKRAADPGSSYEGGISEPPIPIRELAQRSMHRSHSLPLIRKDGSVLLRGNIVRLIPISPNIGKEIHLTPFKSPTYHNDENIDAGEHISEEAVCRICLIEFGNSPETFKMECNCKGELALAHQECATKWFSTKGNRICDVCRQEVQNLSIELLPVHAVQTYNIQGSGANPVAITRYRQVNHFSTGMVWQDVPFLVIMNMLAYFGFLEQLLAGKMGSSALAISLPFSCIFGLLASMTAATMVLKEYIWIYAAVQLSLVIAFSHVFYSKLHMQAIVAVLLATFSGFGVTMALCSILEKILRRTRPLLNQSNHQTADGSLTTDHASNASRSSTWSSTATRGPTAV